MSNLVDLNLHSRTIGAYGLETLAKFRKYSIFIHTLRGVGIEAAKNLILSTPGSVTLYDPELVSIRDFGTNFCLKNGSLGILSRAEASIDELRSLNSSVKVSIHTGPIDKDFLIKFDIVVITDFYEKKTLIEWNEICRNHSTSIGFIYSCQFGLASFCYTDFGDKFLCFDIDGEKTVKSSIRNITNQENALVLLREDNQNEFDDDEIVRISQVDGIPEINEKSFKVSRIGKMAFSIDFDTSKLGEYKAGGIVEGNKKPLLIKFNPLYEFLEKFNDLDKDLLVESDSTKSDRKNFLHLCFVTLLKFYEENKRVTHARSKEDFEKVMSIIKNLYPENLENEEFNQVACNFFKFGDCQMICNTSIIGSCCAQEAIKFTGKFMPIKQLLYLDTFELLPDYDKEDDYSAKNSRYDDQIVILGKSVQDELMNKKIFLVGAGALGCEFIKISALSGLCCGPNGELVCIDDDNIQTSNLSRQFLFKNKDVGFSKVEVAKRAGLSFNKDLNFTAHKAKLSEETENIFDDKFWESIDSVVNAVDNADARVYINSKCVLYEKPFFESGTFGPRCHTQVILPFFSEVYIPPRTIEQAVASCTLRYFPSKSEHCIQWARDFFEGLFSEAPKESIKFFEDSSGYLDQIEIESDSVIQVRSKLNNVKKFTELLNGDLRRNCINLAREIFEENFYLSPLSLLETFPIDSLDKNNKPYWSGNKRAPKPIRFDPNDILHQNFIISTSNLLFFILGLDYFKDFDSIAKFIENPKEKIIERKAFDEGDQPNEIKEIATEFDKESIAIIKAELKNWTCKESIKLNAHEFEKDEDSNYHIDFIASFSNLRARNYGIEERSKIDIKLIAGKIIPAVSTATSIAVGAVSIELFKRYSDCSVDNYRNLNCNLAISSWLYMKITPPSEAQDKEMDIITMSAVKTCPQNYTKWDKIEIQGPQKIDDIIKFLKENYELDLKYMLLNDSKIFDKNKTKHRINMTPEEALQDTVKEKKFEIKSKYLMITVGGKIGNFEADIAPLKYIRFN